MDESVKAALLPQVNFENLFTVDPFGQKLWAYHLGDKNFKKYQEAYQTMGKNAALATPHSDIADKQSPQLKSFNAIGETIDHIEFHPSYDKLRELSYGAGIVAQKYTGPLAEEDKPLRHLIGFSTGYYFAQTETGLFCPICMTDSLGRVLELHAKDDVSLEVLNRLKSTDIKEIWEGAMFLTEKQGGSDVGANSVYALNENGQWKLYGEKWFCSNANAGAILVLARVKKSKEEENSYGTKGLGLFLLTRERPQHNHKNWQVKRLKDKLGVRSMASAEIQLNGAHATLIGEPGVGFKMMTDMVNMSRLYNSVASLAIARRALLEAKFFAEKRTAFGKSLIDLSLYRHSLAELQSEFLGLHFLVFETIKQLDLADMGSEKAASLLRVLTPLCKALTGKFSVFASAEGMELIGGNAYIEEHILPRLYRDAQVLPIWEGTTQIQSLDILRIFAKEEPEGFFSRIQKALDVEGDKKLKDQILSKLHDLQKELQLFLQLDDSNKQKISRRILENLGRTMAMALMFEGTKNSSLSKGLNSSLSYMLARNYFTDPMGSSKSLDLQNEEDVLKTI